MRAYLTVIVDAFREALASRILWIALGLVVLVLLALAPLGSRAVLTTDFTGDSVYSRLQLLKLLGDQNAGNPATRRIVAALEPQQRDRARAAHAGTDQPPSRRELAEWLTALLDRSAQWYDAEAWEGLRTTQEERELAELEPAQRTPEAERRLARLRLEAALPGAISAQGNRSVRITYGGLEFPRDFPFSPQNFRRLLNSVVLPLLMNLLLGVGGILVAILVTAPVVPQLFQSGSLPLLLSKPIRRAPLLLSVMLGATAFIIVCVTPLVTGLMLIAWLRFDLWNPRLLLCIPLFLLLFLVYYSVSAAAALVWRNAIVSVAVTAVFWLVCFIVQFAESIAQAFIEGPERIARIAADGDRLLAATQPGRLQRWDERRRQWVIVLDTSLFDPRWLLGPVVLPSGGAVAAQGRPPLGGAGRLLRIPEGEDSAEATWPLPSGCSELAVDSEGAVIATTVTGPYRLPPALARQAPADADDAEPMQRLLSWLGGGRTNEAFVQVLPAGTDLYPPVSQVVAEDGHTIVYTRGELIRVPHERPPATAVAARSTLPGEGDARAQLAIVGSYLAVARHEQPLAWLAADSLRWLGETHVADWGEIRQLLSDTSQERLLVLTREGDLYQLPAPAASVEAAPRVPRLDDALLLRRGVQAMSWDGSLLLVVHHGDSVDRLRLDAHQLEVVERLRPRLTFWRIAYRYFVRPLATVTPQPSKLGATVQATILGDERMIFGDNDDVSIEIEAESPWKPLVNCLAFTVVMVTGACIYFQRLDL